MPLPPFVPLTLSREVKPPTEKIAKEAIIIAIQLNDRDLNILNEITKWRFMLGRQIKILCDFQGQRACDRRLKKLIEAKYIERKHIIYGIPSLYFVTPKAKKSFNLGYITQTVRIEQIQHDIYVIDTAIYFIKKYNINRDTIVTERELKHKDGFGNNKHRPDFTFVHNDKKYCVEVELTAKKYDTLDKNMKNNYLNYDGQKWITPFDRIKVKEQVEKISKNYTDIDIIPLSEVVEFVKTL